MTYSPPLTISSPLLPPSPTTNGLNSPTSPSESADLDTTDELAVRALLLGIVHRTVSEYAASRQFLTEAHNMHHSVKVSTWVGGVACFELAVLDLKEAEANIGSGSSGTNSLNGDNRECKTGDIVINGLRGVMDEDKKEAWSKVLDKAHHHLDIALGLATQSVDLSSRLDTRIAMLKDEIALKKEMIEAA